MPADHPSHAATPVASALHRLRAHLPHLALVAGATGVAGLLGFGLAQSLMPLLGGRAEWVAAAVGASITAIGLPMALWMRVPQQAYLRLLSRPAVPDAAAHPAAFDGAARGRPAAAGGATVTRLRATATTPAASPLQADSRALAARQAAPSSADHENTRPNGALGLTSQTPLDGAYRGLERRAGGVGAPGARSPGERATGAQGFESLDFSAPAMPGMALGPGLEPLSPAAPANSSAPFAPLPAMAPAARPLPGVPGGLPSPMAEGIADAQRSVRDALTGAYTQQHFVAATDREWSRIRRHGEDAALLMIDVDRFKGLNERYGPDCGDALLVELTRQVSGTLRQYDLLARFGGGVLVVYLPHTDPMGALDVAERIRERVATLRMQWQQHSVRSTVSIGVAGIGASHGALDEVIADAGTALRDAKAAGRNCVRAAPIPPRRRADTFPVGSQRPLDPH